MGNAFFEKGTLILDLKNARFAYSDDAILRNDSDASPITYVHHAGWDGGHIVVPNTLPGQPPQQAMFDTGAALFTFTPLQHSLYETLRRGQQVAGIVGLGGFAGQTITIDYPSRKWKVTR